MIMKKSFILVVFLFWGLISYAQDKVILKTGEELNVKVVKNDEKTIEFQYPGESLINVKNKREIKKIIYESGREEMIDVGINLPEIKSEKDWEKVVETYLESDVEGLTRVDDIKATSGWGGSLGSSLGYKDAIKKLKKKAAKLGACIILIHGQPNQSASSRGGGVQVIATAYK
jgi:hypothetical protein